MTFQSNVRAMLFGVAIAQAIPFAISPLLTRLYTPEAFGLQTLFVGWVAALGVLATCRYELAINLAETDDEAVSIGALALLITLAVCSILFVVVLFGASRIASLSGHSDSVLWIWLVPAMVLSLSLAQIGAAFLARQRIFRYVAQAGVINQLVYAALAVGIGVAFAWNQALVVTKFAGQLFAAAFVIAGCVIALSIPWRSVSQERMRRVSIRYRQFLFFNTPYSLIGSLARDVPIFVFFAIGASSFSGFYGLARAILSAPTLLIAGALSQVYYREAVLLKGTVRLEQLTLGLMRLMIFGTAPLFAYCAVWGDHLFEIAFGAGWKQAGYVAMLLAPAAWMALQTGWPERLFEVAMRQEVSFRIQLIADAITVCTVAACAFATENLLTVTAGYSLVNVVYHHAFLLAIFRVSLFERRALMQILLRSWVYFAVACIVFLAIRLAMTSSLLSVGLAAIVATVTAALMARRYWTELAPLMSGRSAAQ